MRATKEKPTAANCQIAINDPIKAFFLPLTFKKLKQFSIEVFNFWRKKVFEIRFKSILHCYNPLNIQKFQTKKRKASEEENMKKFTGSFRLVRLDIELENVRNKFMWIYKIRRNVSEAKLQSCT